VGELAGDVAESGANAATGRYSRQIRFAGIGDEGQAKLGRASVLVLGCGALGSAISELLVRAGVGRVRIVDRDIVEESNLQRQSLFTEDDAREELPKAEAAAGHLRRINSNVEVDPVVKDFSAVSGDHLLEGIDLAVDGTDNFPARFVLNDLCFRRRISWIYGACVGATGVVGVFAPPGPCLRCFLEEPPPAGTLPTCETAGIIPSIPHLVAAIEVTEALKLLVGTGAPLRGLLTFDLWERTDLRQLFTEAGPRAGCATCGTAEFPSLSGRDESHALSLCGRNSVQVTPRADRKVDLDQLATRLAKLGAARRSAHTITAEIDGVSFTFFSDGRCLLRGVDDPLRAQALYAKYVGS